jgi:uncharacterized membrane protein
MKKLGWGLLAFLSVGVALYAVVVYSVLPVGALVHPDMRAGFEAHAGAVYAHVFSAMAALLLGPTQFSNRLRQRRLGLHRLAGRLYLGLGVLLGGLSGLYLSRYAFGGPVASAGFAALALCWLYTGARAYLAIRRKAVDEHRASMVRNFALSLAAVMLRIYIPLSVVAGLDFPTAYAGIAWLCWVPNLVVAERLLRH